MMVDWCCMCKRSGKTTDHLLVHCPVTREMWNIVFSLFGINWVMPRGVVELLASWPSKFNRHRNEAIWGMTLIASCGVFDGKGMLTLLKGMRD